MQSEWLPACATEGTGWDQGVALTALDRKERYALEGLLARLPLPLRAFALNASLLCLFVVYLCGLCFENRAMPNAKKAKKLKS